MDKDNIRHRLPGEKKDTMIHELDNIILECDLPDHNLTRGDIGTVARELTSA